MPNYITSYMKAKSGKKSLTTINREAHAFRLMTLHNALIEDNMRIQAEIDIQARQAEIDDIMKPLPKRIRRLPRRFQK
jgi:hypothetical protein